MRPDTITWRYYLEPISGPPSDSWSVVFVDDTGAVAVLSDYGHYSFRWHTPNTGCEDFRDFLVDCGADYVASKIGRSEDNDTFDGEGTEKRIRERIAKAAKSGEMGTVAARREQASLPSFDNMRDFDAWVRRTKVPNAYELAVSGRSGRLDHWVKVSLPRLQAAIREQLAAERGSAA